MSQHNEFLGIGWAFPPQFSPSSQQVALTTDQDDIRQSLTILLSTAPGERIMHPDFGCKINRFMFSDVTQTTLTEMEFEIRQAILLFESRIDLLAINLCPDVGQGKLMIELEYLIVTTNVRDNMVYPFYLQEGTLINNALLPNAETTI